MERSSRRLGDARGESELGLAPAGPRHSTEVGGEGRAAPRPCVSVTPIEVPSRIGRYTLERELARGAMSTVFLAREDRGRAVALKVYEGRHANPARFAREVTLTSLLRHPHIVRLLDGGFAKDRYYLAMDLVEGCSLAELIQAQGAQPPERSIELILPVVRALAHAHARGIVHRDIKPENVLVRRDGRTFLTDFGLALDLQESSGAGQRAGTPAFMAPEQALGSALDARVDIYGIGGTLYECLTGTTPFPSTSASELRAMILGRDPPPPSAHAACVPPALDALVLRCLAKRPRDRHPSAQSLALALERVLDPTLPGRQPLVRRAPAATLRPLPPRDALRAGRGALG